MWAGSSYEPKPEGEDEKSDGAEDEDGTNGKEAGWPAGIGTTTFFSGAVAG